MPAPFLPKRMPLAFLSASPSLVREEMNIREFGEVTENMRAASPSLGRK